MVLPLIIALSVLFFDTFAAYYILLQKVQNLQLIDNISVRYIDGIPSDIHQALN